MKYTAIVLAGGSGRRMKSSVPKQYMPLGGKPVLYYSLEAFEESPVDEIILVAGESEIEYCRSELVEKYGFEKIAAIVRGGRERYDSVYEGLKACRNTDYVLIHDGARPFVDQRMIGDVMEAVKKERACVVGMPVKDTIKIADGDGYAVKTPNRSDTWMIQTPQAFDFRLIYEAYTKILSECPDGITDDAMVVERAMGQKVKLVEGSYRNIKITTQEDMAVAEAYLNCG